MSWPFNSDVLTNLCTSVQMHVRSPSPPPVQQGEIYLNVTCEQIHNCTVDLLAAKISDKKLRAD